MSLARLGFALLGVVVLASSAHAGQAPRPAAPAPAAVTAQAPPPPVAPAVINRDASGKATIRATRISTPLKIDGKLDEAVYKDIPFMSDFIQNDPKEGAPATEKTDVWVFYDDQNFYVVARCWETKPHDILANEMRRDNVNIVQNDQFAWGIDTFYNKRDMIIFEVSASGGRIDGQVTNERQVSLDWNPIWDVKTGRFEGGYIVEGALPFKSLRYKPGREQVWGIQFRRHNAAKNEYSYLTPIPASVTSQGHFRAGMAPTLVGIEAPQGTKNLDIKPYAIASLSSDKTVRPPVSNKGHAEAGVDVKYGLSQSLTADFTVNTDFAQVEADEQQVNLTRFSLFFPEKRDFFLENAGVFSFGSTTTVTSTSDTPILFYSRNIGLVNGVEVPIRAGARVSGRTGKFTLGAINVQSGEDDNVGAPATNFSVLRVRRDISRRSNVGAILTNRSKSFSGVGSTQAFGVDTNISVGPDLAISAYLAGSKAENVSTSQDSYRAFLDYNADRYGVQGEHLMVGRSFDPQVGFVRRRNMRKDLGMFRFSPRPKKNKLIRKHFFSTTITNIDNTDGHLETRLADGTYQLQFQNTDYLFAGYTYDHEFLPLPFRVGPGVTLPVNDYDFGSGRIGYNFGKQRNLSGNVSIDYGTFYNGHKTTLAISSGRVNFGPQISVEPSLSLNKVDVVQGQFTTKLVTSRVTYTMTPLMFASALIQYNSGTNTLAANVRFRWEYQPGSEMFVVFNQTGDTLSPGFPNMLNRSFVVKINRVFRF